MPESRGHVQMAAAKALGGLAAIILFIIALAAFVIQSSLTQYVQGALGFRQPFFLLYIAHSSFIVIFPLHLIFLILTSRKSMHTYFHGLKVALVSRLLPAGHSRSRKALFPSARFVGMVFALSTGINVPGMLWYASVSLSSISDVTAIWNTNSFWVYLLTVKLYQMKWESRKLGAVMLACFGVILDVYGGSRSSQPSGGSVLLVKEVGPTSPLLGDGLTLVASISYALYQVLYKRYAALPNAHEVDNENDATSFSYESLSEPTSVSSFAPGGRDPPDDEPTSLPFGLYANFLTSCMGFCTLVSFALGFPILHWLSVERFTLPPDMLVLGCIVVIAGAGVVFNSCFMILLGLWGPVLTSVGNLLTIVLVLFTDFLFNGRITVWSLLGSGMVVAAFGVLVFDMVHPPK